MGNRCANQQAKPRGDSSKFWLVKETFLATQSLLGSIASLSEADQKALCYLQDKVILLSRRNTNPSRFVNIGSRYFKERLGSAYRRYIDVLIDLRELEVNGRYKADKGDGYSKSYRVPVRAWESGIVTKDFRVSRFRRVKDRSTASGELIEYFKKCFSVVVVRDVIVIPQFKNITKRGHKRRAEEENHEIKMALTLRALRAVHSNAPNFVYGDTGRLYHTLVEMPSEGRINIKERGGAALVECDIKSCHPFLLLSLCPQQEKAHYAAFLETGDFYSLVAEAQGMHKPRKVIKEDFMYFLNGNERRYFHSYFNAHFPQLTGILDGMGKEQKAGYLQGLEAELVVQQLGAYAMNRGLFFIPMHDGWITKENEAAELESKIIELAKARIGFEPRITTELVHKSNIYVPLESRNINYLSTMNVLSINNIINNYYCLSYLRHMWEVRTIPLIKLMPCADLIKETPPEIIEVDGN